MTKLLLVRRKGEEPRTATSGEKRVFRFGTSYTKFAIGCNLVVLVAFACFLGVFLANELYKGEEASGALAGFVLLVSVIVLLAIYGRKVAGSRIEIERDAIVLISGNRRVEGSLREVASLHEFGTESGAAYRIVFCDGTRIDFNSDIEDADILRAQVQRVSGKSF